MNMNDFGLGKLLDSIGGALHIFDFSFFISGSVTFALVVIDAIAHCGRSWLDTLLVLPAWIVVMVILLSIYVCGLMSWSIGRELRKAFIKEDESCGNPELCDFTHTFDSLVESLGLREEDLPSISNKMDIYYYMWIKLDSLGNDDVKGRLAYCNRMWVMRALFEGLLFSWLLGILILLDLAFSVKWFPLYSVWYTLPVFILLILLMYFTYKSSTNYANSQIKEIVIAYKIYVLEASRDC